MTDSHQLAPSPAEERGMMRRLTTLVLVPALLLAPSGCYMGVAKDTSTTTTTPSPSPATVGVAGGGATTPIRSTAVGRALVRGMAGLMALYVFLALVAFGFDA